MQPSSDGQAGQRSVFAFTNHGVRPPRNRYQSDITLVSAMSIRKRSLQKVQREPGALAPLLERWPPTFVRHEQSRLEPDPKVGDQRQVVRRHQRLARARHLDAAHLDLSLVIDVIEVDDREDAGIGAAALQVLRRCRCSRRATDSVLVARPRIHSLKSPRITFGPVDAAIVDERRRAASPDSAARAPRCPRWTL